MSAKKKTNAKRKPAPKKAAGRKSSKALKHDALKSIESNLDAIDEKKKMRKPKGAAGDKPPKKMSLVDAAAHVLKTSGEPLNTRAMMERITAKGLWSSPAGKTPHATLYSGILKEMSTKGKEARFRRGEAGKFIAA